jgi:VanZ family protein
VVPAHRLLVLRCGAWFCVALIAYLSLIPRSMEVRTFLLPGLEHALAYGGTAGLMVLAYLAQPIWLIIGALCAYSGLMELLQTFSVGRHPGLDGALWSSAGAIIGGLSIALCRRP